MKRYFICLANSKKYRGRCLAGIEYIPGQHGEKSQLARLENGEPRWIRPVSLDPYGSVPNLEVANIELLDLIAFDVLKECPEGYQSENVHYKKKSFEIIGKAPKTKALLDNLVISESAEILGNDSKMLSLEEIKNLQNSIVLVKIKATDLYFFEKRISLRAVFTFGGVEYEMPVTDIDFHLKWLKNKDLCKKSSFVYLCISISKEFQGNHSKLVAGILPVMLKANTERIK